MTTVDLRSLTARYDESGKRCPVCSKRTLIDVGPGVYGDDGSHEFCIACSALTPESSWAAYDTRRTA